MKGKWIEVFRSGVHVSSDGQALTYSNADLDTIIASYKPDDHEAPVVIGHPKNNAPAYGWVEALKREGDVMLAKLKEVPKEFADAVKAGFWKKRSISLYPDMRLRHVGFLGAVPPAVKGLADIAFNEDKDSVVFEFSEDNFKENNVDIDRLKAELDKSKKTNEAMQAQLNALSAAFEEEKDKNRMAATHSFCEGLVDEGKLTPAQKESAAALLTALNGSDAIEFNEENKNPVDLFKEFLGSLPVQVDFEEQATREKAGERSDKATAGNDYGEVDQERLELHEKALKKAKEENIEYSEAIHRLINIEGE